MTKRALRHCVVSLRASGHEGALAVLLLCACLTFAANRRFPLLAAPSAGRVLDALELGDELPMVLIAFQIVDCANARTELGRWNHVRDVSVVGVLVGPVVEDRKVTSSILDRSGVTFPVLRDGAPELERLLRLLGFRRTPAVLAFDDRGRLVRASPTAEYADDPAVDELVSRLTTSEVR